MTKSVKTKERNYGIALLKTWMCFEVILCHFDTEVTVRAMIFCGCLKVRQYHVL